MPFPAGEDDDEDDEEGGGGDGDRQGRGNPGQGKGLSREQKEGLDMIKHVMLSLDEEDGLDQIYTFRCFFSYIEIKHISHAASVDLSVGISVTGVTSTFDNSLFYH